VSVVSDLPDEVVILRAICDPGAFTKRGDYDGETYGESVPHWSMRAVQKVIADWLDGRTVLEAPSQEQWFVWAGGPDPDNAAMCALRDDEADAREYWQWVHTASGSGIARRDVYFGPWEIVAAESSEGGESDE
jgi:hypothetical protein